MIQFLSAIGSHTLALVVYPGLLALIVFGAPLELVWKRLDTHQLDRSDLPRRRPTPMLATVALCSMLAAAQLAAPFNPMPADERNVVIAAIALAFTTWIDLAATRDVVEEPRLLLVVQACWLLAVLGPAVQPESLRPQVLGNVLVPALLPLKVASGFLYLLSLPGLLRLWPLAAPGERRLRDRLSLARGLCWLPYCGLFTTLFFTPSADDVAGLLRFLAISAAVGAGMLITGWILDRRGPAIVKGLYARAVPGYATGVLGLVVVTSFLMR